MAPGEPAWKSVGELASIGMTMVLATVIGLAGGYYADRWLGTSPIFLLIGLGLGIAAGTDQKKDGARAEPSVRSEEHTSELQSRSDIVCRLLLEKKKKII